MCAREPLVRAQDTHFQFILPRPLTPNVPPISEAKLSCCLNGYRTNICVGAAFPGIANNLQQLQALFMDQWKNGGHIS